MKKFVWVELPVVLSIHDEQLAEHGGAVGVRDMALLESALVRPRQRHHYASASLSKLAVSYAYGIARNHPFVDGNKRTSLVVAELFLALNGVAFNASDESTVVTWLKLAAGELTKEALAHWFDANTERD